MQGYLTPSSKDHLISLYVDQTKDAVSFLLERDTSDLWSSEIWSELSRHISLKTQKPLRWESLRTLFATKPYLVTDRLATLRILPSSLAKVPEDRKERIHWLGAVLAEARKLNKENANLLHDDEEDSSDFSTTFQTPKEVNGSTARLANSTELAMSVTNKQLKSKSKEAVSGQLFENEVFFIVPETNEILSRAKRDYLTFLIQKHGGVVVAGDLEEVNDRTFILGSENNVACTNALMKVFGQRRIFYQTMIDYAIINQKSATEVSSKFQLSAQLHLDVSCDGKRMDTANTDINAKANVTSFNAATDTNANLYRRPNIQPQCFLNQKKDKRLLDKTYNCMNEIKIQQKPVATTEVIEIPAIEESRFRRDLSNRKSPHDNGICEMEIEMTNNREHHRKDTTENKLIEAVFQAYSSTDSKTLTGLATAASHLLGLNPLNHTVMNFLRKYRDDNISGIEDFNALCEAYITKDQMDTFYDKICHMVFTTKIAEDYDVVFTNGRRRHWTPPCDDVIPNFDDLTWVRCRIIHDQPGARPMDRLFSEMKKDKRKSRLIKRYKV